MADIKNPVTLSVEQRSLIQHKANEPAFTHSNWGDDDLKELRKYIRKHYQVEQMGLCAYCKEGVSLTAAANCHVEHIAPKSLWVKFLFEPKNLCVICADCNTVKRNQEVINNACDALKNSSAILYPRSSNAFKIVHPHFDNWAEHIQKFGKVYVDLSEKGAFTISACVLNRYIRKFGWKAARANDDELQAQMLKFIDTQSHAERNDALDELARLITTAR